VGFDIVHLNLHKTFATPHGGGGPGAGPVGVSKDLIEFLPISVVAKDEAGKFYLDYNKPKSIGYIAPFYGNFGVILKTYVYILALGKEGLIAASEAAVLAANYIRVSLKGDYYLPYDKICMHECVFSASKQKEQSGITALDIAKYLIDNGIHPPTVYFPLIVKEALMIEPTESESKETLDYFIELMKQIAKLAVSDPQKLKDAPRTTPVKRLDETKAARELNLIWHSQN
jgi:glycine dehydrogenase subunit 2